MSVRAAKILAPDTVIRMDDHGDFYARSPHPLAPYPDTLTERLDHWAVHAPDRTFLASRDANGHWRRLTYSAAHRQVRSVAESLLERRLSVEKPVLILSGNSIEHAVLALAAMYVGVPYAPVAPSYSLVSTDFQTLGAIWTSMRPGLVFAGDGSPFERALACQPASEVEIVTLRPCDAPGRLTLFDDLLDRAPTALTDEAHAAVGPDTIAKILFTSGSTGTPKGVINTQRMLSANQEQIRTTMPFLADEPPVLCDWLPWNHTFGGNHNFGLTMYNGGTLYLDAGSPTPAGFDTTLSNLRQIATTAYFNVPKGYEMLLPALRVDAELRRVFFSQLKMLFYAAAGLRQQVADEIEALAEDTCGQRIPWVTGLGATESAPLAIISGPMAEPVAGRIGVPVPGVELKAARVDGLFEARLRGPNITPGYWRDVEQTREAFDDDGFYCMGDAIGFVDPSVPSCGFTFQGRLTEDFKLSSGTWVRVGPLRAALLAHFADLVQDFVVAGHDRDDVRLLIFPNLAMCRSLIGSGASVPASQILMNPAVRDRFTSALAAFAALRTGSSTRVEHAMLLETPPSIDAQEITDKGSINQKAVLRNRAPLVDVLYGAPGSGRAAFLIDVSARSPQS